METDKVDDKVLDKIDEARNRLRVERSCRRRGNETLNGFLVTARLNTEYFPMPIQHRASSIQPPAGRFWPALESARGLASVPACWLARLGEQYEAFRAAFLTQSSQPAKYYPCPRGCGCMHEIAEIPNSNIQHPEKPQAPKSQTGTKPDWSLDVGDSLDVGCWNLEFNKPAIVAVCRCEESHCPDIPLTAAEAILLELSWTKLARAICHALNLDSRPRDLGLLNTRQIGSWSAGAVPVILTVQNDHAWFRGHVLELISRLKSRFILLAPTSAHFDAIAQELIENANAGFFPLESNVRLLPSGLLQATKTPGELFARFTPDPKIEPGEDVAKQAFALVEQLETGGKPPSAISVFRLYCMEGLSANKIARRLRCSKPTVLRRLKWIEKRVGVRVERLRACAGQFEEMEGVDDRTKRRSLL
jgi:hypothetical protein